MARLATCAMGIAIAATLSLDRAAAQEEGVSTNRVAVKTVWSVFVEDNPTQCWVVVAPKKSVNTRNGKVVKVKRSEIRLHVSFRPGDKVMGEVSFLSGYPFAKDSTADLTIGDEEFQMVTSPDEETAWPTSAAEDRRVVAAMKRGAEAVIVARSSRGTRTQDTFSLLGFTAAFEEAEKRCGG